MNQILLLTFTLTTFFSKSQDQFELVDILTYRVNLEVFEEHDTILVDEQVRLKLLKKVDSFYLDLHSLSAGKGMEVSKLLLKTSAIYNDPVSYTHSEDKLWVSAVDIPLNEEVQLELRFTGIPETGLIIGKNKFDKRTFFGDNWPNRAHHWFACVDHPSDKAKVDFLVRHPKKYNVVATGRLMKESYIDGKRNFTMYSSEIEMPTKVMVVGIAEFDKKRIRHDHMGLFPMTAWVYEDDSENGFKDMAVAADVVNYFVKSIAGYPFEKLDHVQSTTQFGGMENAGNIFYDENAVTGEGKMEALIAHEVAHQWFGNSASESDWQHLWLSEGFATYFTDLYWENKYGTEAMNERLITERNRVIRFSKQYDHPVVDTTYQSLMQLLNPNSYQKGAWILHMLRAEVSDSVFWNGIRTYYENYKYSNAATADFQSVMESESGKDLSLFFNQWLHEALHPILLINNDQKCGKNFLEIQQKQQTHVFEFDLEVEVLYEDGTSELQSFSVSKKKERFKLKSKKKISGFKYDPNVKLLFEMVEY